MQHTDCKRIVLPARFNHNTIEEFLRRASFIFPLKDRMIERIMLEADSVSNISVVGILLLYKFMEYVIKQNCCSFPEWKTNKIVKNSINKYGFTELMDLIVGGDEKNESKALKRIMIQSRDNFIIAPQPLIRKEAYTEETLRKKCFPELIKYYGDDDIVEVLLMCITEILTNFYKHAISDDQSILVAEGNKQKIEIACADTGDGIIRTIKEGVHAYRDLPTAHILRQAVRKGVTSKPGTYHMGRGLWLLDRIATLTGGKSFLFSQGGAYKNVAGKVEVLPCGHWEGTVIYLNLPLQNRVSIMDVLSTEQSALEQISLNILS